MEHIMLLEQRDERALEMLKARYGTYCRSIIYRLLRSEEETDEAMDDLWLRVWESVPPVRPLNWKSWLARTARNIAIDRIKYNEASCRNGMTVAIEELADCLPDPQWEDRMEMDALREILNGFVRSLKQEERRVFVLRYWYGETVNAIAVRYGFTEGKVHTMLHRLRGRLKRYLEQEGYAV